MTNDLIKQRDAEIQRLKELLDAQQADYELLKLALFRLCREARYKVCKIPGRDQATSSIRIYNECYTTILEELHNAGLEDEYDEWYTAWLEGALNSGRK